MAVQGKRAVIRCESRREYANLKPYRYIIRYGFFIYERNTMHDDETPEEKDDAERDDLTDNEAHRTGEFDDLRDMLGDILDKMDAMNQRIDGIYDKFADSVAQMVENGAVVKEDNDDDDAAEAIAKAAADDLENLDYIL